MILNSVNETKSSPAQSLESSPDEKKLPQIDFNVSEEDLENHKRKQEEEAKKIEAVESVPLPVEEP
jgi:hypothetical protein